MTPYGVAGAFHPHLAFVVAAFLLSLIVVVTVMIVALVLLTILADGIWLSLLAASFRYADRQEADR